MYNSFTTPNVCTEVSDIYIKLSITQEKVLIIHVEMSITYKIGRTNMKNYLTQIKFLIHMKERLAHMKACLTHIL